MPNKNIDEAVECCFEEIYCPKNIPSTSIDTNLSSVLKTYKDKKFIHYLPHTITWKITSKCNLKCKHCFYYTKSNKLNSKTDFSTKELLETAQFLVEELNIIKFTITGGEPLLRKDIFKLLKYLKSKNVSIDLQTNATIITEKIASKLAKILNPQTDRIQISLEGACEKTHDKIRGKGSFLKTIYGIRQLVKNNFSIKISYTLTSININELSNLYDLCKKLKVKMIALGQLQICSNGQAYLEPKSDDIFIAIANLIKRTNGDESIYLKLSLLGVYKFLNYKKGRELLDNYLLQNQTSCCQNLLCHSHESININWDGKVYLCTLTERDELCLGDLKKQSFFEIWENRFNNVFFQERDLKKSVCKNCKYVNLCRTGCPAMAYLHYGDINAPHGDCSYGKILMEEYKKGEKIETSCIK